MTARSKKQLLFLSKEVKELQLRANGKKNAKKISEVLFHDFHKTDKYSTLHMLNKSKKKKQNQFIFWRKIIFKELISAEMWKSNIKQYKIYFHRKNLISFIHFY